MKEHKPAHHTLLARRLRDLAGYVEMEMGLPSEKRVPTNRLTAFVHSALSEFKSANLARQLPATA